MFPLFNGDSDELRVNDEKNKSYRMKDVILYQYKNDDNHIVLC
jgi:hypothetical protein